MHKTENKCTIVWIGYELVLNTEKKNRNRNTKVSAHLSYYIKHFSANVLNLSNLFLYNFFSLLFRYTFLFIEEIHTFKYVIDIS